MNILNFYNLIEYYQKEAGTVCNDESHVIRSQSECTNALNSLGYRSLSTYWTKAWGFMPSGCSIANYGDWTPHFELNIWKSDPYAGGKPREGSWVGKRANHLIPICKRNIDSGTFYN